MLRHSSERLTFHQVVMGQSVLFVGDGQDAALLYIVQRPSAMCPPI